MAAAIHSDMNQLSRLACANFRSANEQGLLSDAFIAANNTNIATFRAAVGNVTNLHAEILAQRGRLQRAIDYDGATAGIGDITDANIATTSTEAALELLTQGSADRARLIVLE